MNEKRKFFSYLFRFSFLGVLLNIVLILHYFINKEIDDSVSAFNNGEELLCYTSTTRSQIIVSKQKGFRFEDKDKNTITNDQIVIDLKSCERR